MGQDKIKERIEEDIEVEELDKQPTARENLMFFGFAVATYIPFTSILISSQDILASTSIPTATIITCYNTPYFILTLILPYFVDKLGLQIKAYLVAILYGVGLVLIAVIPTPAYRLLGVVVASLGFGVSEIGFLSGTALHQELTLHSFTSGTGIGGFIGTAYITVISSIICIKPSTALLCLLVLIPVFPLLAWLKTSSTRTTKTPRGSHVQFTRLNEKSSEIDHSLLTWKEKFTLARENLVLALCLFIGLFGDFLTTQATITTIVFQNTPFDPRNQFVYYQLVFWGANIIGRSYGLVILLFKPNCTVVTDKTWILSVIIAVNTIILLCASWYRFLPSFGIAAMLLAITGVSEGALYLNAFAVTREIKNRPRSKEFSRAFLTVALLGGTVAAGLVGLGVEPMLRNHCQQMLYMDTDPLCFTRLTQGKWNATSSCLV